MPAVDNGIVLAILGMIFFYYIYSRELSAKKTLKAKMTGGIITLINFVLPMYLFAMAELIVGVIISGLILIIYFATYGIDWLVAGWNSWKGEDIKSFEEHVNP